MKKAIIVFSVLFLGTALQATASESYQAYSTSPTSPGFSAPLAFANPASFGSDSGINPLDVRSLAQAIRNCTFAIQNLQDKIAGQRVNFTVSLRGSGQAAAGGAGKSGSIFGGGDSTTNNAYDNRTINDYSTATTMGSGSNSGSGSIFGAGSNTGTQYGAGYQAGATVGSTVTDNSDRSTNASTTVNGRGNITGTNGASISVGSYSGFSAPAAPPASAPQGYTVSQIRSLSAQDLANVLDESSVRRILGLIGPSIMSYLTPAQIAAIRTQ